MEQQSKVKNKRKLINPVFHFHTEQDDEQHITKNVKKTVRRTGQLNLSGKHLVIVPAALFTIYELPDENEVNVDFNRQDKEEEVWWNLKSLTHLDLSSNVLTQLPGEIGIFQDLSVINLQDNKLISLPREITYLTKLTKLNLNHNKINNLPKDISKLGNLRVLLLSNNCIQSLPEDLVDLVMLEKLDLSKNKIERLPKGIGFLVRLTDFNVSSNLLTQLPLDIVSLRSLSILDISHNSIKKLPDNFTELRKLQILNAQHNDIEDIPDLSGCEILQEIYFGNNFIKEVPSEMCEYLVHLKILELRDNHIKEVPAELVKLVHLSKLDLTNNKITDVPPSLALLPHLQTLKLEGNKLKQIRADIIQNGTQRILQHLREKLTTDNIQHLTESLSKVPYDACVFPDRYKMRNANILNLTMKNLTGVPEEVFIEAKEARVTMVDLCKNKLTQVPQGLELLTNHLIEINFSTNHLKEVPDYLSTCRNLKFLDLSNNQLSDLPPVFDNLKSLREFVLFNNRYFSLKYRRFDQATVWSNTCHVDKYKVKIKPKNYLLYNFNRFKKIPECIFEMTGLEILMLNDNCLDEINTQGLSKLSRLAVLNLSNNNITHVPPDLGNMKQLKSLELKGNPFRQPRYAILEQGTEAVLSYLRDKIPA